MDTTLSPQDRQRILDAIDAIPAGGVDDVFCKHWETAKAALNVVKKFLPPPVPAIIDILIELGDMLYKKCPA